MKKTYINPEMDIVQVAAVQLLDASNPGIDPNEEENPGNADAPVFTL